MPQLIGIFKNTCLSSGESQRDDISIGLPRDRDPPCCPTPSSDGTCSYNATPYKVTISHNIHGCLRLDTKCNVRNLIIHVVFGDPYTTRVVSNSVETNSSRTHPTSLVNNMINAQQQLI